MLRIRLLWILALPVFAFGQISESVCSKSVWLTLEGHIPLTYNSYVRAHINDLLRNDRNYTSDALARFKEHEEEISRIISEHELPPELKFLALSMSGCSNFEQSEEGGTGYYLMRYSVAKAHELHISSYVDERRDIEKATDAMCKEMKILFLRYGDWHKALAAF